jgi:hypothetical protein
VVECYGDGSEYLFPVNFSSVNLPLGAFFNNRGDCKEKNINSAYPIDGTAYATYPSFRQMDQEAQKSLFDKATKTLETLTRNRRIRYKKTLWHTKMSSF